MITVENRIRVYAPPESSYGLRAAVEDVYCSALEWLLETTREPDGGIVILVPFGREVPQAVRDAIGMALLASTRETRDES